ncbi:MAG: DUF3078 domain-containing protein [Flavobacteriales bacterium]|jgi:hypothetical protein|tara:strand:+ start:7 stop:906 length:900 start_codon:yes stop_codon:yes gene_type:complete
MNNFKYFIYVFSITVPLISFAQADSTETYTKMHSDSTKTMEIDRRGLYNFNFMWANLDNWTQGGKSNLNGTVMLREQFKIKTENTTSSHLMMLNYGLNNQDKITSKTIDNIQYVGNFARGGIGDKRWARISTQLELNSQIMPGYENGDTVKTNMISRIASPLYAQVSLGAISNKFKSWSLYCAPIGSKTTIILDSAIRESGAFGIDSTSSSLFQGGANATLTFNKIYFGSLRILLRTDFFYNYLNDNPALDVRGEFIAYYKLDRWFSVNANYQFIRDNDAIDAWQLKSVLGLGITLSLK